MLRRSRITTTFALLLSVSVLGSTSIQPASASNNLQSNLFILDVSGSINSVDLWKNLRVSVVSKLSQPFGIPNPKFKKYPVDVAVTAISQNSANSPIFRIVSNQDAQDVWGAINLVFPNSTDSRIKTISNDLFGDNGAWNSQARIFNRTKIIEPEFGNCKKSTLNAMNKGTFLRNTDNRNKMTLASVICEKIIKISKNLKSADEYFSQPACDKNAICSDVAGAIYRASSLAADLENLQRNERTKNSLCVAIASDMLNEYPGMSSGSLLNSKKIALNAKSIEEATAAGYKAAKSIGIKFSPSVNTKAVMVGIGSGPNPIALERNSYLLAYWQGFWSASGIKESNQAQSLNQACS